MAQEAATADSWSQIGPSGCRQTISGYGPGDLLLVNALTRAQRIYAEAGGIGLFVDAIDEHVAGYYYRFGFVVSPDNPKLLLLPAKGMG